MEQIGKVVKVEFTVFLLSSCLLWSPQSKSSRMPSQNNHLRPLALQFLYLWYFFFPIRKSNIFPNWTKFGKYIKELKKISLKPSLNLPPSNNH